jgi:hypothetical protein
MLFFTVGGWTFTILPRFLGIPFTLEELYWIGIISVFLIVPTIAVIWEFIERRKKAHPAIKIIPEINNHLNQIYAARKENTEE